MSQWRKTVAIKYLFTKREDYESIQKAMSAVADVLERRLPEFDCFRFRKIPQSDEFFTSLDYANKLLDDLYDYADEHRIWIA